MAKDAPTNPRRTRARAGASLNEKAYQGLLQMMRRGELPPGSHLSSRSLGQSLGVSATPMREALQRLASEGLIEIRPGTGAFVHAFAWEDIDRLYRLRLHLEPFVAAEAARHATDGQIAALEDLCAKWRKRLAGRDAPLTAAAKAEWEEDEERFHRLLFAAAGNPWLEAMAANLHFLGVMFTALGGKYGPPAPEDAATTTAEHTAIATALRLRKPEDAAKAMTKHLGRGHRNALAAAKVATAKGRG